LNVLWGVLFLGLVTVFVVEMSHSLKRSNTTARLVKEYGDNLTDPRLLEEIYAYCLQDYKLKRIMARHGATKEDIAELKEKLSVWGDFKKGRRLVPINSFFYAYTLDYLLKHKADDPKELTVRMMNFFHI